MQATRHSIAHSGAVKHKINYVPSVSDDTPKRGGRDCSHLGAAHPLSSPGAPGPLVLADPQRAADR
jgi:hypothetical protein